MKGQRNVYELGELELTQARNRDGGSRKKLYVAGNGT